MDFALTKEQELLQKAARQFACEVLKSNAAKWLVYRAAYLRDAGKPYTTEAAMCKLNTSENVRFVTNLAMQIHGGYDYMHDYPLERMHRDAKITEIYEGTSEIHKVVISRAVLNRK